MRKYLLLLIPLCIIGLFLTVNAETYNAIKLYISPPTETSLGGVYAQECPINEWILGIDVNGNIICGEL